MHIWHKLRVGTLDRKFTIDSFQFSVSEEKTQEAGLPGAEPERTTRAKPTATRKGETQKSGGIPHPQRARVRDDGVVIVRTWGTAMLCPYTDNHCCEEGELLAVDGAVFHYEGNFFEDGDVVERIAGDGDDIGGVAGLEDAESVLPTQ